MELATELPRIRIRKTGVTHLIMTVNSFSPTNFPWDAFTSSDTAFGPMKKPTKMQVKKATMGMSTLLLTKSMISRIVMFAQVMKPKGPNPREDGMPMTRDSTVTKMQAPFRLQWNLSRKMDTMVSIREMEDVRGREDHEQEEGRADQTAHGHGVKHLWQDHEHKARSALEHLRIAAGEDEHRGDDHQAGQEGDHSVKDLDLAHGALQVRVLAHVGSRR